MDGELVGTAYDEPVTATDRTWELLTIGVRRDGHGEAAAQLTTRA